ncbi:hypothetical protein BJ742DRAFT_912761 [Cladochytrium replicatum]|nr:hypothetical protein BJ742DRAFT_912761 [Cladochytrium replicatum]
MDGLRDNVQQLGFARVISSITSCSIKDSVESCMCFLEKSCRALCTFDSSISSGRMAPSSNADEPRRFKFAEDPIKVMSVSAYLLSLIGERNGTFVDANAVSAGELASGDKETMVKEGMRTEVVLKVLERKNAAQDETELVDTEEPASSSAQPSNASYLSSSLRYIEDDARLLDAEDNGVMMGWERVKPKVHVIMESHPDVVRRRWQEVLKTDAGATQDGGIDFISFDTFGEYYTDLREFNNLVPNYLSQEGLYSFFNGLSGTNSFFHDACCRIAEGDLLKAGLDTRWVI